MIYSEIAAGTSMTLDGWLCTTEAKTIILPTEDTVVDFCTCDFDCDYIELALVNPSDETDLYQNDYRSFLINLKDASSTFEFKLIASDGTEYVLNDNTYGEFFNKGFNTTQPLKAGYRLDWFKVYDSIGADIYTIRVSQTDFSNTVTKDSHKFRLIPFNEIASNKTVKMEIVQRGAILNGEDYGGMSWGNMIRVSGTFGSPKDQYDINRLQDSNYNDIDVQIKQFKEYTLQTELLPSSIGKWLTDTAVMTDDILISVNDVFNYDQYRRLAVTFTGDIETPDDYSRNVNKSFTIRFKDKVEKLKRNFVR
jgi:hypothetical protein